VAKPFYELIRGFGGLSLEYSALTEADFTATAGAAYAPPERGNFRRINVTRTLQLLMDATGVIETFQTSAAEVRLPANTITEATNDAGNGRLFFLKNSGTGSIVIKDYLGTTLWTAKQYAIVMVVGNDNDNWDFYFTAKNIDFSAVGNYFTSSNTQAAIEESTRWLSQFTKEATGFVYSNDEYTYERTDLTFTDLTRTLSIAVKSPYTSYIVLINNVVFEKSTAETCTIDDIEGDWYIYFNSAGLLVSSQTPWTFIDKAFVAHIYWDFTNKKAIRFEDERHGCVMDYRTHRRLHRCDGTVIELGTGLMIGNYIDNGDGSLNSHAQYSISDGFVWDEDSRIPIRNAATPTAAFEQVLSTIAYMPVFYLSGATPVWRRKEADAYAFYQNPPNPAYYNMLSAGSWSLQACTNDYFFATWIIYGNDLRYPVASILGQRQDANLISAINNNARLSLANVALPFQEAYFYRKLIWQTNTTYGNTPKVRLRYIATASEINPANDRYACICNYNGNAGTGKYLDFYPGQSSDLSPFPIPEVSYIRTIALSAIASSTGTVSFYLSTDLVNPIFAISLTAQTYIKMTMAYPLNVDDKIVAKVSSGSINKPAITLFIQTSL